jgi:hypothetical protein
MAKTIEELKENLKNAPSQDEKAETYRELYEFVMSSKSMSNGEKLEKIAEANKLI